MIRQLATKLTPVFTLLWGTSGFFSFTTCQQHEASRQATTQHVVDSVSPVVSSGKPVFAPVVERLLKEGADTAFVALLMSDSNVAFQESFVKINVTGYLKTKTADYSHNYNEYSIEKSKEFLATHDSLLAACEAATGVPREVITSVMWVETKHGQYLGKYNVASVYMSLALADQPANIQKNKDVLRSEHPEITGKELEELDEKIESRAKKKAAWALQQVLALQKMQKRLPIPVVELRGSWAGAFGLSQFLPSSYLQWGKDGDGDGKVDLYTMADAVYSIANYLKSNGWGKTEKRQRKAVFHYNNSNDYVDAVLILASMIATDENDTSTRGKSSKIFAPSPGQ